MLNIRAAVMDDFDNVKEFYYTVIDGLKYAKYSPDWKKDIYPTKEYLAESIKKNELYVGEADGKIVSCMVVNHEYNEGFGKIKWSVDADDSELYVVHILGVLSAYSGRGFATQMVQKVIETARENGIKTIRLDVLDGNLPAEKTYVKSGFKYVDTIDMFYENEGFLRSRMFEYIV
ncbi:MAG: GNAT family N-acetyltransferase [Oscillospiraceae bacterium]|nr:GNAT family N-acetyltransferase [Oscillospiraceae bacterium]